MPSKYILLLILLFGFFLRVNNLTIGFPSLYVSNDEAILYQSALNVLASKTPFTIANYGPLASYVQVPFLIIAFITLITTKLHSIKALEAVVTIQEGYFLFVPRVISAMFGTLTIISTFFLAKEIFKKSGVALWASFLVASSLSLVHISHLGRSWSAAIFFAQLATLFAFKSLRGDAKQLRNTFLSFFFAALCFGFHQISSLIFLLIVLIKLIGGGKTKLLSRNNVFPFLSSVFLVFIFNILSVGKNFFSLIKPGYQHSFMKYPEDIYGFLNVVAYTFSHIEFYKFFKQFVLGDFAIIFFFLMFFVFKNNRKILFLPFIVFIFINYLLSSLIFVSISRDFLVAFSMMPIFAAACVFQFVNGNHFKVLLSIIIIFVASFNSLYWNYLLIHKITDSQVVEWLDSNISQGTPIASTLRRHFDYVPNLSAVTPIRNFKPRYYQKVVSIVGEKYVGNVRNVIYANEFGTNSKVLDMEKVMQVYPVAYIVDSYWSKDERFMEQNKSLNLELVAHFSPVKGSAIKHIPDILFDSGFIYDYDNFQLFRLNRPGPYFDILKVN
jgi:hypothetical protein